MIKKDKIYIIFIKLNNIFLHKSQFKNQI